MKPSGLDISGEHTKKQLNLVLVLKSKALYGSCSVNNSLKSSLGVRREEIGTEEGVGESRDWNLNGSSRKAPLRYQELRMRRRPSSHKSRKRFSHGCTKTVKWLPYCCSTPICSSLLCKHFLFSQKLTRM